MNLNAPRLDSRTFEDLVREARERIPRFTPEWTNFNDSDPGMTLVQLHAWMTETILYELNRVPELNYVKFLDLIGVTPEPARPARTELGFTLDRLDAPDDALVVQVPLGTRVSVADPDIKADITFETDRSLVALNADFGMVVAPDEQGSLTRALLTDYGDSGATWLHFFAPFDDAPKVGACLYVGLLLRPRLAKPDPSFYVNDALPAGPLDLYVDVAENGDAEPGQAPLTMEVAFSCAAAGVAGPQIEWQLYTGQSRPEPGHPAADGQPATPPAWRDDSDAGWKTLSVSADSSRGLAVPGHLVLELPSGATAVDPRHLPPDFWASFGALKPPASYDELLAVLDELDDPTALAPLWPKMGVTDATVLQDIAACGASAAQIAALLDRLAAADRPDPAKVGVADWQKSDPAFAASGQKADPALAAAGLPIAGADFRRLYWLRAKFRAPAGEGARNPGLLRQLRLNTVAATQGVTRLEDRLPFANGRPGQVVSLPKAPVLIDPASGKPVLDLVIGGETDWRRATDFFGAGPDTPVYVLDPAGGRITFGDGLNGRIPVAGSAIIAARSRIGGGAIGNVGPGTITKLKGQVAGVKSVTNPRAAVGGSDAETLQAVKLRAPHDLRHRDRAVSAADFEDLALATPGAALHKVLALPRRAVDAAGDIVARDGAVTLVLLPVSDAPAPKPTNAQLDAVCRWLEPRRLVTTELHLTAPRYVAVTGLGLTVRVGDGFDLGTVTEAVLAAILAFVDPIRGGVDGSGWPFGQPILHADLYDRIMDIAGVRRAWGLSVTTEAPPVAGTPADVTPLPEGALPVLTRDRIALVVGYD